MVCKSDCGNGYCYLGNCICYPPSAGPSCNDSTLNFDTILDGNTAIVKLEQTTLSINFISVQEIDQTGNSILSYPLSASNVSINLSNDSFVLVSYFLDNNSTFNISYNTYTVGQIFTFAKQNISIPPNTLKLTISIQNWNFSFSLNSLKINLRICEEFDCSGNMTSHYWTKDVAYYTFFVNYASNGIVDGAAAKVATIYNQTSQTTTLIVPHFYDYAILDPDFSVLINANPRSSPHRHQNEKTIGIAIGAVVGLIVIILVLYLSINRLRYRKVMRRDSIALK